MVIVRVISNNNPLNIIAFLDTNNQITDSSNNSNNMNSNNNDHMNSNNNSSINDNNNNNCIDYIDDIYILYIQTGRQIDRWIDRQMILY